MPNYRYIAFYPRFFPAVQDANGKSLEAKTGMVVHWDSPPSTAEWAETSDPVTWPVQETPPPAPEPARETFRDEPEPEMPVAVPGVPQEPERPSEPVPVPDPPAPEAEPEPAPKSWLDALSGPPARA